MDKEMERLYREAVFLDKSDYYKSKEYERMAERQRNDYLLMIQTFGDALVPLMEDYLSAVHEELQIEKRHFFILGYEAGKRDAEKKKSRVLQDNCPGT